MSGDIVIRAEELGKKYIIGHDAERESYVALRDVVARSARKLWRKTADMASGRAIIGGDATEEFWALKGVSFEVKRGEVVGIIGRNGAGKSTLLKILSRITEPSEGRVTIKGRVASLLEIGTGFHPELTGRENIYLSGAVLGMTRAEIRRKFDEIVVFAEISKFLDTPVKRYSSGMYVRLAFAVAAHLDPEILLVDEVLAVGDEAFQRKCLGKMKAVASLGGRTVLFVSHNLQSIRQLCPVAIMLSGGRVQQNGPASGVIDLYYQESMVSAPPRIPSPTMELLDRCYVTSVAIETLTGEPRSIFPVDQPWRIRVAFRAVATYENFVVGAGFVAAQGLPVQTCWLPPQRIEPGNYEVIFEQVHVSLEAGRYKVVIGLTENGSSIQQIVADWVEVTREGATTYLPDRMDVGIVLNSMNTHLNKIK
jgi:lipopolysaccharide transport system ATP-binding protein